MKKKVIFLTAYSSKIGYGHFIRCLNFSKVITNKYSNITLYTISTDIKNKITKNIKITNFKTKKKENFNILKDLKNSIVIIDFPKKYLNQYEFLKIKNKLILIDNYIKHKNCYTIYPTIIPFKKKDQSYGGKNWIILNPKINKIRIKQTKEIDRALILYGGSLLPSKKIILHFKNLFLNYLFVLGPLVNNDKIKFFKKNKINYVKNPKDFFTLIASSKYIFTRYGISMYEALSLRKKPIVFIQNEKNKRKKEILFLMRNKIIDIFYLNKNIFKSKFNPKIEIKLNKEVILNLFKKIEKND